MAEAAKEDAKKEERKGEIVSLKAVYPDALEIFNFRPKSSQETKDSSLVVLDTNALLVPYGLSGESLELIEKVYRELIKQNRLFIPSHVAREFAHERTGKLTDLFQRLNQKLSKLPEIEIDNYPLLASVEAYKRLTDIEIEIRRLRRQQRTALQETIEHVQQWKGDDRVSLFYGSLFNGDLLHEPELKEEFRQDLENRKNLKRAPGYKDAKKSLNHEGDLVIWYTILDLERIHKKSLIFVSGEAKNDWFHRSDEKPIFLKYELLDEYRRSSEGETFHLLKFSAFLQLFGANTEIVKEVQIKEIESPQTSEERESPGAVDFFIREKVRTEAKHKGFEITSLRQADFLRVPARIRFDFTYELDDCTEAERTGALAQVKGFCKEKFYALPRIAVINFRWVEADGTPKENNIFFSSGGSRSG